MIQYKLVNVLYFYSINKTLWTLGMYYCSCMNFTWQSFLKSVLPKRLNNPILSHYIVSKAHDKKYEHKVVFMHNKNSLFFEEGRVFSTQRCVGMCLILTSNRCWCERLFRGLISKMRTWLTPACRHP